MTTDPIQETHPMAENSTPSTLLLFIDGLGIGPDDPTINPIHSGCAPCLSRLLREQAVAVDACLDMRGLPQSATGQATLLTGCNAAALVGRHVEGLPGPKLKELVREKNIFSRLIERDYSCTFANAYFTDDVAEVHTRRRQSVTTVAALQAFGTVRDTAAMLGNRAVYQDLTREFLRPRGYTGPAVTPREAAVHLLAIAAEHDFTLFEYFQTDLKAHTGDQMEVVRVLAQLDEFISGLLEWLKTSRHLLLLTSDHGNVEDSRTSRHTRNPVPLVAIGSGAKLMQERVKSLTDFVPALLALYPDKKNGN